MNVAIRLYLWNCWTDVLWYVAAHRTNFVAQWCNRNKKTENTEKNNNTYKL